MAILLESGSKILLESSSVLLLEGGNSPGGSGGGGIASLTEQQLAALFGHRTQTHRKRKLGRRATWRIRRQP